MRVEVAQDRGRAVAVVVVPSVRMRAVLGIADDGACLYVRSDKYTRYRMDGVHTVLAGRGWADGP